jgi:hypothetical protein
MFDPEKEIEETLGRIDALIEESLSCLDESDKKVPEAQVMTNAGSEICPRAVANAIEEELLGLEDWIEEHFADFCERKGLMWDRVSHLRFAPHPGWIADGCRDQLDSIEASLDTMRDLCLEYAPHCAENSGLLAIARSVADSIQNPIEGYKAYIGGHKKQIADRDFGYRFQRAGIDIGSACGELGSEIVVDVRRELKKLYRSVEVTNNKNGEQDEAGQPPLAALSDTSPVI